MSSRTPQSRGPSARATSSAVRTESFSKSTRTVMRRSSGAHSANFIAASTVLPPYAAMSECGHGPEPATSPPRRLGVRGHADLGAEHGARDVGRVAVARLHAVVVVTGRHEDDRLPVRGLEYRGRCSSRSGCAARACRGRRSRDGRRPCSRPRSSSPSPTARSGRRRGARGPSSPSQSWEQSLRIAIDSSIPPTIACLRWKSCITTRGCRSSWRSAARVWLKYASV